MIKLITSPVNIRYLSGFTGSVGILFSDKTASTLIVDGRYTQQAVGEVHKGIKVLQAPTGFSLWATAFDIIKKKKVRELGFEDDRMDVQSYNALKKNFPKIKLISISSEIREARCVKSEKELSLIRQAASISDIVYDCIIRMVNPGITENDIAAEIDYLVRVMGGEASAFEPIVASGAHSALAHHKPSSSVIKKNDLVIMDFGARYKGYNSDMTRMISFGAPSKKQLKLYNIIVKAQEAAIERIKSGVDCSIIDKAARDVLKKEKLSRYFEHATGHGIGLAVHEGPRLSPTSRDILKEGMVVTVEPGFYLPGIGGFRVEDMVLVKKNGYELLTKASKKLEAVS